MHQVQNLPVIDLSAFNAGFINFLRFSSSVLHFHFGSCQAGFCVVVIVLPFRVTFALSVFPAVNYNIDNATNRLMENNSSVIRESSM